MRGLFMRKYARFMTALVLSLSLALPSVLAAPFPPLRFYGDAGFTDVDEDWSLPYIRTCYEIGLMSGRGDGLFAPAGTVSVAEGVTAAARVHSLWRGGTGDFSSTEPWYAGAIEYALDNGIFAEGAFSDYSAPISRRYLASLLAKALPPEEYLPINSVATLPDVTWDEPCGEDIFTLYNAGILTGTDPSGTFLPDTHITRAELSAILCRLVQPGARQLFSLEPVEDPSKGLSVLYFYATWCEPCRQLSPTIDQLIGKYQPLGVSIQKIDVDKRSPMAARYQVSSYPTLVFLWDGQEVERRVGGLSFEEYCALMAQWL